jgi:hypothetical protein
MDVQMNDLVLSDLKIGAIICICLGYFFLILPEDIYTDVRNRFCPEPVDAVDAMGHSSLTRRYKYTAPASPHTIASHNHINSSASNNTMTGGGGGGGGGAGGMGSSSTGAHQRAFKTSSVSSR